MLAQESTLERLVERIESVLAAVVVSDDSSSTTGFVLVDRLDQWQHLGVVVSVPETRDTDRSDGREILWLEDTVSVGLRLQVQRTAGQREIRDRATEHERVIRREIVSDSDLSLYRPTYLRTTRRVSADRAWYEVDIVFRFERFERARVVA